MISPSQVGNKTISVPCLCTKMAVTNGGRKFKDKKQQGAKRRVVLNAVNSVQDRENDMNIVSRWLAIPVAQLIMVKIFIHQQQLRQSPARSTNKVFFVLHRFCLLLLNVVHS